MASRLAIERPGYDSRLRLTKDPCFMCCIISNPLYFRQSQIQSAYIVQLFLTSLSYIQLISVDMYLAFKNMIIARFIHTSFVFVIVNANE